jgi:glucokinase
MRMMNAVVGVDIGGTNTVIGVFDNALSFVEKNSISTVKPNFPAKTSNPKEFFDVLADEIQKLVYKAGFNNNILCVGVGVPGKVNSLEGIAMAASNLGYVNVPFASELADRLGVPVYIDNDVRNYTLGEYVAGSGKGFKNIVCLTLGTGIAAGVMIEGKILTGHGWYAGELGHDIVWGESSLCNCGKRGCLETIASANGIARLAAEVVQSGKDTILREINRQPTSLDVYNACLKGDKAALQIFDYVGTTLARKLLTVTFLLNPEAIIIGGGAAAAGEFLLGPVRTILAEQYGVHNRLPEICTGELGDSAGLIGSAYLALHKYQDIKNRERKKIL